MDIKKLIYCCVISSTILLPACGSKPTDMAPPKEMPSNMPPATTKDQLANILVSCDFPKIQGEFEDINAFKQKILIDVTNHSNEIFDGFVSLYIYNSTAESMGSDTVYIVDLEPGNKNSFVIWTKVGASTAKPVVSGKFSTIDTRKYQLHEILYTQDDNGVMTQYVKVNGWSNDAVKRSAKELKAKNSKDSIHGLRIFFYSEDQEVTVGIKPNASDAKAHLSVNYAAGLSELSMDATGEKTTI